ncbi:hypothetical protein PHMEG_00040657 [Phytophthora megakarya]|uniref:Uncharacterized protein n=1 Tax=Phytophthora megakarya TaxID=4795 RepID=A0A225UD54_9STRA|nr:hypothetical protein PHMEG_00040657 [Phytophthora megakarya]
MPAKTSRSVPKQRRKTVSTSSRAPKKVQKAKQAKKEGRTDPFTSKQVSTFYFKCVSDDDGEPTAQYVCRCGVQHRMEPNTGYTNLLGHGHHDKVRVPHEDARTCWMTRVLSPSTRRRVTP